MASPIWRKKRIYKMALFKYIYPTQKQTKPIEFVLQFENK